MRGGNRTTVAVALVVLLAGCALPHRKDTADLTRRAVSLASVSQVVMHHNLVRQQVDEDLDASALADIETGALLDIDAGRIYLQRRLDLSGAPVRLGATQQLLTGSFDSYPLWFAVISTLPEEGQQVAAVFARESSTSPWLATEAPRLAATTEIPQVSTDESGSAVVYDEASGGWSDGRELDVRSGLQRLATQYAEVLEDPEGRHSDAFVDDSFREQMAGLSAAQPSGDVTFSQTWRAQRVQHAFRLADGGTLVFVTLTRTDRYQLARGRSLDFTGLEAGAYFRRPIDESARLTYHHQLVLLAPAEGLTFAIGQYGGLVKATGT